ncbi:porin [Enterovibrio coralii]|uniref:Porin domain-containing protein n=1 Tax=Enterovibrio coralii TaxID=294935 RepID=A0A135I757_9GAMM|nr:porin [Enterovibrio coralii]KXF81269.1 hypothetical protein ATN88_00510 [Enterovibrio coralii]
MEKMFKRSVLGAAVAFAAVSGSANAAIELVGQNVVLYGQAAGFAHITNPEVGEGVAEVVMESRIGFRGRVEFDNFSPDLIWQMEGGNAGSDGGSLGQRDTFIGLDFDGVGSFKYGRQLVASYNYVDWPHSNPGLGNVFDGHNTLGGWSVNSDGDQEVARVAFEDRANNVFRFDSATFGGINFQATLSGMGSTRDALVSSVATSYTNGALNLHAGYYNQARYTADNAPAGDNSYIIVGGSLALGDITLTAGWKSMENGLTNNDQDAFSATAQYVIDGTWMLKAGYAATTDSKLGDNDGSTAITGRVGYLLPSAIIYTDVRSYDYYGSAEQVGTTVDGTNILIGMEYYF